MRERTTARLLDCLVVATAVLSLPRPGLAQSEGLWVCTIEVDTFCVDGAWPEDACVSAAPDADWGPFNPNDFHALSSDYDPERTVEVRLTNRCGTVCTLTLDNDAVVLDPDGEHLVEVTADDAGSYSWPFLCDAISEGSGDETPSGTVELVVTTCTGYATAEGPDCPDYEPSSDSSDDGGGGGGGDGDGCAAAGRGGGNAFGMFVALGMVWMRARRGPRG